MSTTPGQGTGPVAVITGASSGIGEATARALAASGYRLALLARRADRIKALADELGNGSIAIQADVTDRESIVRAAGRVKAELGGTDVLVNNAGIMLLAPFTDEGHDDHRRMIEANLLGAITVTEVFLDQLRDGGGDLVNLSSVAGRTARPGNAVYAATKWGINGWSESLRQELRRHPPPAHDPQRNPRTANGTALSAERQTLLHLVAGRRRPCGLLPRRPFGQGIQVGRPDLLYPFTQVP